jgi:hypothetical protein
MTTLRDQALNLARAYPGGAAALALRMSKNPTTLNHELVGQGTAKLGLEDTATITALSGDLRVLEAWNAEHGLIVIRMPQIPTGPVGGCLDKLSATAREFSELVTEVAADLGDNRLNDNELHRIEREGADLLAAVHQLLAAARALNAEGHRE